jgi:pSer/pThr/pTyr-binding forkhead associated (FHA) protein
MVIESETTSRRHAELRLVPEGVQVSDLDSKNGLYFLGHRFQSMILQPGSRFRLGSVEVSLDLDRDTFAQRGTQEADRYADRRFARNAAAIRSAAAARGLKSKSPDRG